MKSAVLFLAAVGSASAFVASPVPSTTQSSTQLFGGAQGYSTSLAGKKERVEKMKELLDTSDMIFAIPAGAMTVQQTEGLRRSLPEGTTAAVVKNKLMARAVEGTDYEAATALLKGPNMWFFIDEDISGTIKAYNGFLKTNAFKESHPILGGVVESTLYDAKGIDAIGKLPSKDELYAQIAGSIKGIPTKVARVIKAPNSKLARAIKLATMPEPEE
jgi:large subunit ribosomal protein L10